MNKKKNKKKKKKFRIKFRFVFLFILFLILIGLGIKYALNIPITNIFISGNSYLNDQKIIEIANIEDYPSTFKNSSSKIEKKLKDYLYIKDVKVSKKLFTQIYIKIEENRPLFFNQSINKTVLLNKKTTDDIFDVPTLINYVPDVVYDDFIKEVGKIDISILNKISEIKYDPEIVDYAIPEDNEDARFLLTMSDSNYVYVTLGNLEKINNYNNIIKQFKENEKGILTLDSGGHFKIAN